jgi:hypothetical protein
MKIHKLYPLFFAMLLAVSIFFSACSDKNPKAESNLAEKTENTAQSNTGSAENHITKDKQAKPAAGAPDFQKSALDMGYELDEQANFIALNYNDKEVWRANAIMVTHRSFKKGPDNNSIDLYIETMITRKRGVNYLLRLNSDKFQLISTTESMAQGLAPPRGIPDFSKTN